MKDKIRNIVTALLFGGSSVAILTLVWVQPSPVSERVLVTAVGLAGLLGIVIQWLLLSSRPEAEPVPVPVEAGDPRRENRF